MFVTFITLYKDLEFKKIKITITSHFKRINQKNIHEDKPSTPSVFSRKKKLPPKKQRSSGNATGHSESCECDVCSSQFPLRTHLMLDMSSYSRLQQNSASGGGGAGGSGSGAKFSIFGRYKKPLLSKEDRRPSSARVNPSGGIPDPMQSGPTLQQQLVQMHANNHPQQPHAVEPVTLNNLKQDCFMIPAARMANFFPAGHPIPNAGDPGRVRMLETADPHLKVVYHMMTPCKPLMPTMQSPLFDPHLHQKECILKAFRAAAIAANCPQLQGMLLMNLERECEEGRVEFSFMIVWIIDARTTDQDSVINKVRKHTLESLDPAKTGYSCGHHFDTYDEVVTLARPPIDKLPRKATTPGTGYIIGVYRVFEGDDGQKFERNWLLWTGAKTLYRSLTSELDLRRFTLHKSTPQNGVLHYILMCDCSNFLTHIACAVKAVPMMRMRLTGDIGLYRPIATL